jgi:hypothetical protein
MNAHTRKAGRKAAAIFFIFEKSAFWSECFAAPELLSSSRVVSFSVKVQQAALVRSGYKLCQSWRESFGIAFLTDMS